MTATTAGRPPHLFLNANELLALREKARHPRYARDWDGILFRARRHLETPLAAEDFSSAYKLEQAAGRAARCALAWRVTGEAAFCAYARGLVEGLPDSDAWPSAPADHPFGLTTAAICHGLAVTFDLLAEELPREARARFAELCERRLARLFLAECKSGNQYLGGQRTMNHNAVHASGALCLFIALDGEVSSLAKEIEIARAQLLRFVDWYDDAGGCLEINAYWDYGMGNALRGLAAARANGWPEIFRQRAKKLERTAYPFLYAAIGAKTIANFGDGFYGKYLVEEAGTKFLPHQARARIPPPDADPRLFTSPTRTNMLILAAAFGDRRLQWLAEQAEYAGDLGFMLGAAGLEPQPPDDLPTCVAWHGPGFGVLRGSMSDPETLFLGLKAGRSRGKDFDDPHCQSDLNSVVLEAHGRALLADPGYWHVWATKMVTTDPNHASNSTKAHNTLQVGGKGLLAEDNPVAHLQDLSPEADLDYLVSRLERGYGPGVLRYDRHAYFAGKAVFVLLDDVTLAQPEALTWNFHGPEEARWTCLEEGGQPFARLVNGPVSLEIRPFGAPRLKVTAATDHLLPRVQFDTVEPVADCQAGWLLLIQCTGKTPVAAQAELGPQGIRLNAAGRAWHLPVVRRRVPIVSDLLAPFPRQTPGARA